MKLFDFDNVLNAGAAGYLAGMIDGEGTVVYSPGRSNRSITITNTDPDLIAACVRCCEILKIECRVSDRAPQREGCKPQKWLLICGQENLRKVLDLVPICSPKKRNTLKEGLDSYIRAPYKKRVAA